MERLKFFDKDPIQWPEEIILEDFYRTLFQLKKRNPALSTGDPSITTELIKTDKEESVLAWRRKLLEKEVIVMLNLSSHEHEVTISDDETSGSYLNVFEENSLELAGKSSIKMSPWEYLVLER